MIGREVALRIEDIRWHGEQDRARAAANRAAYRLMDQGGEAVCPLDLDRPFDDMGEERGEFDFLKRLLVPVRRLYLPDQRDQWCGILVGGVQGDRHIRGTDAARPHAKGGHAGQFADRLRHEGRAALVPRRDE